MSKYQRAQVEMWIIILIGGIIGIYFPTIGIIIIISGGISRYRAKEIAFAKEFIENNKLYLIISFVICMALIANLFFDQMAKSGLDSLVVNYFDALLPLLAMAPLSIYYEYKLFKHNASHHV